MELLRYIRKLSLREPDIAKYISFANGRSSNVDIIGVVAPVLTIQICKEFDRGM